MPIIKRLVAYTTNTWESPLATLRIIGPVQQAGFDMIRGSQRDQAFPELVSLADAVVIQRDFPRRAKEYQEIITRAHSNGKPVILDLDDLLLELPEDHPDRSAHYYTESLIPIVQAIMDADLVTASTSLLCEYLRQFNPNIRLLPNYLNDHLWTLRPPKELDVHHLPVVVGYVGSESHLPDIQEIGPVLFKIVSLYGDKVTLRFLGARPPEDLLIHPAVTWSPARNYVYADFAAGFGEQKFDLVIAPLRDNLFNRCKSPIKFLEYSTLGVPGVYARLETYTGVVTHGKNGFLASSPEEWEECLARLIENADLRYALGEEAQATTRSEWLLSRHTERCRQVYSLDYGEDIVASEQIVAGEKALFGRSLECTHSTPAFTAIDSLKGQVLQANESIRGIKYSQVRTMLRIIEPVQSRYTDLVARQNELQTQLEDKEKAEQALAERLEISRQALQVTEIKLDEANQLLNEIHQSRAWKLVKWLWRLRLAVFPHKNLREAVFFTAKVQDEPSRLLSIQKQATGEENVALEVLEGNLVECWHSAEWLHSGSYLPRYDVIIFPIMEWESRMQRPQQIALQFAHAGHRVFFVRTVFRPESQPLVRQVSPGVYEVILPASYGINIYTDTLDKTLQTQFEGAFASLKQTFGIVEAVCIIGLPVWAHLGLSLRKLNGWKVIYDCMDYHKGFSTNSGEMLSQENLLIQESDLVLATSHFLYNEIVRFNPNCVRVPNGTDFDHFRFPTTEVPKELSRLGKPIVGYYGAIADWFDAETIRILALARPGWSFVLIGGTRFADLEPLQGLGNVHLLGEIPYSTLPAYLHTFDVAIIPFKKTPLTEATNPVKLFEYLSAGKAVVGTGLDELRYYHEFVRLASDPQQWLMAIEEAMDDYSMEHIQARLDFARQNTWKERFKQIEHYIVSLFPKG